MAFSLDPENWITDPDPTPLGIVKADSPAPFFIDSKLSALGMAAVDQVGLFTHCYWFEDGANELIREWHTDARDYDRGGPNTTGYYTITFSDIASAGTQYIQLPRLNCQAFSEKEGDKDKKALRPLCGDLFSQVSAAWHASPSLCAFTTGI